MDRLGWKTSISNMSSKKLRYTVRGTNKCASCALLLHQFGVWLMMHKAISYYSTDDFIGYASGFVLEAFRPSKWMMNIDTKPIIESFAETLYGESVGCSRRPTVEPYLYLHHPSVGVDGIEIGLFCTITFFLRSLSFLLSKSDTKKASGQTVKGKLSVTNGSTEPLTSTSTFCTERERKGDRDGQSISLQMRRDKRN